MFEEPRGFGLLTPAPGEPDSEQWWQKCHVPSACDDWLHDVDRSVAVVSPLGSGKTTALLMMDRTLSASTIIVPLSPEKWFSQLRVKDLPGAHLDFIMESACRRIQTIIETKPASITNLSTTQAEFLHWLLRRFLRPRPLAIWTERLRSPILTALLERPGEELYPDSSDPEAVHWQIEELVLLAEGLGYSGMILSLDVPDKLTGLGMQAVGDLFGWLELWQHRRFVLKATVPAALEQALKLEIRSRSRIVFRNLTWTRESCEHIADRWLSAAANDRQPTIQAMALPDMLAAVTADLVDISGAHTPLGWVTLAKAMLIASVRHGSPVPMSALTTVRSALYRQLAPIQIHFRGRCVQRGARFIKLSDQEFRLFEALWRCRGADSRDSLTDVAGSKENMHTLIRRIRKKIEPIPSSYLYIPERPGDYYILEHAESEPID